MRTEPNTRRRLAILWIALLACVGAVSVRSVPMRLCIGSCGDEAVTPIVSCAEPEQVDECCSCCDDSEEPGDAAEEPPATGTPDRPGGNFDATTPECCIDVVFELEPAPVETREDCQEPAPKADRPIGSRPFTLAARTARRIRFDHGPPRVDRRTALRACTVLLI